MTPLEISIACWYATPGKYEAYRKGAESRMYLEALNNLVMRGILNRGNGAEASYLTEKGLAWVQALTQCQPPTVRYIGHNGMEVTPYREPEVKPMPVAPSGWAAAPSAPSMPGPFTVSQSTLDNVRAVHEARARGDFE